ncbi:hypothetical protein LTR87_006228 [Friedmanniomyces endolithicus]|nr:hypothetical protein LTR87_006228 [Friedmanniomyces endolithicus]
MADFNNARVINSPEAQSTSANAQCLPCRPASRARKSKRSSTKSSLSTNADPQRKPTRTTAKTPSSTTPSPSKGLKSIKSQFNGMPKLFERSDTQKLEVLDDQQQPNAIVLNLTQHYVFKGSSTPEKTLNSKITLKMDSNGRIEHHEEEWDHKPNKTGEDGFMGKIQQWRKEASAKMVEMGVSSDTKKI